MNIGVVYFGSCMDLIVVLPLWWSLVDSKNLSCGEGGDIKQVAWNSKRTSFVYDCLYSYSCFYFYCSICVYTCSLNFCNPIVFIALYLYIYCLLDCGFFSYQKEGNCAPQLLSRVIKMRSLEPLIGDLASRLALSWPFGLFA